MTKAKAPESLLVRGGTVMDPSQSIKRLADVLIENGKISAIEDPGKIPEDRAGSLIDASGAWVMPGFIDVHVHLRQPGQEHKETIATGTRAAVAGGFTSVACMANTSPVNDNAEVTRQIVSVSKQEAVCRVYPIGAVSVGLKGEKLADHEAMAREGIVALSDDGMPVMNSLIMRRALESARRLGFPVISHAEDWNLVDGGWMNEGVVSHELGWKGNPAAAEEILIAREIALCRLTGNPVHIAHLSTAEGVRLVRRAREDGLPVTAEATPHHLFLTEAELRSKDTNYKMAPPLRTAADVEALRLALADGLIGMIATDHAPHALEDKSCDFGKAINGIIGLQTAVPLTLELVHAGVISVERWIESMTDRPARLLKIPAGNLACGSAADLTILDPSLTWELSEAMILSKSRNSPFLGRQFRGKIMATIVGGRIAYSQE